MSRTGPMVVTPPVTGSICTSVSGVGGEGLEQRGGAGVVDAVEAGAGDVAGEDEPGGFGAAAAVFLRELGLGEVDEHAALGAGQRVLADEAAGGIEADAREARCPRRR